MDINNTMKKIAEYRMMIAEAEDELKVLEDELKKYMLDTSTEELIGAEHKATYKTVVSKRFDSSLFKREHGDMYEAYKRETSVMRFTFA